MGMVSYISAVVVLCFTVSLFNSISGDTKIDCTRLVDNTTCCGNPGCFFVNCTDKTNKTLVHKGCHTSGNTAEIDAACVADTVTHLCDGPEEGTCEAFLNNVTCCNNDTAPSCTWITCEDKSGGSHEGCHNVSDTATIGSVCKDGNYNDTCPAAPVEMACKDYKKNQTVCCKEKDQGCIFVNCTKDTTKFDGCYSNKDVTCALKIDQCAATTVAPTTQPTTTPTKIPVTTECQLFNNTKDCCSELIYSCISVNCTGGGKKYEGCYSMTNRKEIKAACQTGYLDACAPTTQAPPTTAAPKPPKNNHHFDGASFIGGIVLCAGIVAIVFFGCKWYQSRQGRNYHTL